jgi:hypothetical protein
MVFRLRIAWFWMFWQKVLNGFQFQFFLVLFSTMRLRCVGVSDDIVGVLQDTFGSGSSCKDFSSAVEYIPFDERMLMWFRLDDD